MDKLMEILQAKIGYSLKWGTQDPVSGEIQAWVVAAVYVLASGQGGQFVSWAAKYLSNLVHTVV